MDISDIARFSPAAQRQILEKLGRDQARAAMDKPGKYHNRKCTITLPENGKTITFDSEKEARHFENLRLRLRYNDIRDLRLQANFTLQEGFTTAPHFRTGFAAQPLAALPPYGCGVPLAGASLGSRLVLGADPEARTSKVSAPSIMN